MTTAGPDYSQPRMLHGDRSTMTTKPYGTKPKVSGPRDRSAWTLRLLPPSGIVPFQSAVVTVLNVIAAAKSVIIGYSNAPAATTALSATLRSALPIRPLATATASVAAPQQIAL